MKASGSMIRRVGLGFTCILHKLDMKEIGRMIFKMAKEKKNGLMGVSSKERTLTGRSNTMES